MAKIIDDLDAFLIKRCPNLLDKSLQKKVSPVTSLQKEADTIKSTSKPAMINDLDKFLERRLRRGRK